MNRTSWHCHLCLISADLRAPIEPLIVQLVRLAWEHACSMGMDNTQVALSDAFTSRTLPLLSQHQWLYVAEHFHTKDDCTAGDNLCMVAYSPLAEQAVQTPPVHRGVLQCGCNNQPNQQGKHSMQYAHPPLQSGITWLHTSWSSP